MRGGGAASPRASASSPSTSRAMPLETSAIVSRDRRLSPSVASGRSASRASPSSTAVGVLSSCAASETRRRCARNARSRRSKSELMTPASRRNSSPSGGRGDAPREVRRLGLLGQPGHLLDRLDGALHRDPQDRRGAEESEEDQPGERAVELREPAHRRPDPAEHDERRSLRLALERHDEETAEAVLSAVGLDRGVRPLGARAVVREVHALLRLEEVAGQRDRHLAVEQDRGVVREPELEHVRLETRREGLALLLRQPDELVVGPDRDGESLQLLVDLLEREPPHDGSRSDGEHGEEDGGRERARDRDARAGALRRRPPHRSR